MARIAIVDDNPGARLFAEACLKQAGHEPVTIEPTCLYEVLGILHSNPPDALLLDFLMPSFRGDVLIRALRASTVDALRHMPVLLVTAHQPGEDASMHTEGEGVDILYKPLQSDEMAARLRVLMPQA